jgi:hypothetical protein
VLRCARQGDLPVPCDGGDGEVPAVAPSNSTANGSQPSSTGARAGSRRCCGQAKRAEAERKANADAQKIVAIWNARQAGGRALWFYPTIGAAIAGRWLSSPARPLTRLGRVAVAGAQLTSSTITGACIERP